MAAKMKMAAVTVLSIFLSIPFMMAIPFSSPKGQQTPVLLANFHSVVSRAHDEAGASGGGPSSSAEANYPVEEGYQIFPGQVVEGERERRCYWKEMHDKAGNSDVRKADEDDAQRHEQKGQ